MNKVKPMEAIRKTVHVSDPDCWYERDTVTISLYVGIPFRDWQEVILIVNSIDDFTMAQRRRSLGYGEGVDILFSMCHVWYL